MFGKESVLKTSNKSSNLLSEAVAQRCSAKKLLKKFHTPNSLFNKGASQQVCYTIALAEAFSYEFCKIFQGSFFMEPLVVSILFRIFASAFQIKVF